MTRLLVWPEAACESQLPAPQANAVPDSPQTESTRLKDVYHSWQSHLGSTLRACLGISDNLV